MDSVGSIPITSSTRAAGSGRATASPTATLHRYPVERGDDLGEDLSLWLQFAHLLACTRPSEEFARRRWPEGVVPDPVGRVPGDARFLQSVLVKLALTTRLAEVSTVQV